MDKAPLSQEQPSKRLSTAARHQDLHDRLLQAAESAIVSGGLAKLRARALADAVGCSVGAIYSVFPDLDALILAVNGRTLVAMNAALQAAGTGKSAEDHLVRLACAYLDYAATNKSRWRALFEHSIPEGQEVPDWFASLQAASFAFIEAPLALLRPSLTGAQRSLLARSLFSAVHGMVDLGLSGRLAEMTLPTIRSQIKIVVKALATGFAQ